MTEKEILEGNKLIADFMGEEYMVLYDKIYWPSPFYYIEYELDWNLLIKVVEKIINMEINDKRILIEIRSFDRKPFYSCSFFINEELRSAGIKDEFYKKNINTEENSPIQTIWLTVVKFIKWYNKWYNKKE